MSRKKKAIIERFKKFFIEKTQALHLNGFSDKRYKNIFTIIEFDDDICEFNIHIENKSIKKLLKKMAFSEMIVFLSEEIGKEFTKNPQFGFKCLFTFHYATNTYQINHYI